VAAPEAFARRGRAGAADRPELTAAWLRRRYVEERSSAQEIGAETGWSSQYVRDRLRDHGIPLRPPGAVASHPPPVNPAALAGWSSQWLSLAEISARTGYSRSGVRQLLRRAGLPTRPAAPRKAGHDPAELTEVVRLYRDQGRSLHDVGAAFGRGPDWAKARVRAAGLTIRPAGIRPTGLDLEQLRRWRVDDRLTIAEIAARTRRPAATIAENLRKAGITTPPRRPERPAPDPAALRRLYVDEYRTLPQVAAHLGVSGPRVRAAMVAAGIPLRPARRRADRPPLPPLTAEQLTDLYVHQGLTAREIAAMFGGSANWVLAALETRGIPRRPGGSRTLPPLGVDAATLTDLYVTRRLDDPAIGARLGVPAWRVTARRRELGVYRPHVPPPNPGPPPPPPAEVLRQLYLEQQLPTAAIGKRYHTAPAVARRWLRDAGIPVRPRTARHHRTTLDITQLRELYQDREWTAAEIAGDLDTTTHLVLRALHDAGIPVRRGSRRRRRPEQDTRLLAALYNDPEITAALHRRQVPRRPAPGSIATRFPTAVPLTEELFRDLYTGIGLSARQIELLTGQPHEQILDALHRADVPVRHQHGVSPWLARQRA
jgi:hypothetical protein